MLCASRLCPPHCCSLPRTLLPMSHQSGSGAAVPQTIENTRELVEDAPRTAEEVATAEADDEFADHFARARAPKVLVTTCYRPTAAMYRFLAELLQACRQLSVLQQRA